VTQGRGEDISLELGRGPDKPSQDSMGIGGWEEGWMMGDDGEFGVGKAMAAGDLNRSVSRSSGLHSAPNMPRSRY
jgi:hypothetical protein